MRRAFIDGSLCTLFLVAGCVIALWVVTDGVKTVTAQQPSGAVEMTVLPTEGKAAGIVRTPMEGRWILLSADLAPVASEAYKLASGGSALIWEGEPGSVYVAFFFPTDQSEGIGVRRVVLGKEAPRPPPDPDDPDPPEPDPDDDTDWDADGLHVLIVDDENLRGNLPSNQVHIFTSKPFRDWLDKHAKYRFSSNDSLRSGEEARDLEKPVWVEGWDRLMDAVDSGKVDLPAWIVSDGKTGWIEELPGGVNEAIGKLEAIR